MTEAKTNNARLDDPAGQQRPRLESGVVIKHYELIRHLGTGGMGVVFLARDIRLGRLVAIKFLLDLGGTAARRFLVEARTTAQCRHENIVVIYDVDELDGYPYMVLEYIQGHTLRTVLMTADAGLHQMGTSRAINLAVEVMVPVVRALVCAHEMSIVHRDLKPENILLADSGVVRVLDFGIAKQVSFDLNTSGNLAHAFVEGTSSAPIEYDSSTTPIDQFPTIERGRTHNTSMTGQGAIMGTLPYMSPEQWLLEPIDGRTDIWAVGIILFELLLGKHPLAPFSMAVYASIGDLETPMPSMREMLPDFGALADIVDRCLRKRKEERYASAKDLLAALEDIGRQSHQAASSEDESPFAGLAAFQEADASRFFGREQDISSVVGKLRSHQLVTIAGPSGAGKSSFARAGIIPALKRTNEQFEALIVRPGRRPLMALAEMLSSLIDVSSQKNDLDTIANDLRAQPGHLGATLRQRCRTRGPDHRILLFIDQLEELYTLGIDPEERAAFAASIEGAADDASSPLRVLMTIRADFLDRLAEDRRFLDEVTRGLVFLPPMTHQGLRDALKKPLEKVQYRFEDEPLIDEMLEELAGTKSPLPLLQFAATKLWEARDQNQRLLTRDAYRSLGGIAGALSTHADAVIAGLSTREQHLARALLVRLVTPERTRAIVRLPELCVIDAGERAVSQIVERLATARLLAIEKSTEGEETSVELLHESLIEKWSKLRQWLDEDQQDTQFLAELRHAAQQWEKNDRAEGFLWRDRVAATAGEWLKRRQATGAMGLGPREQRYLEAVIGLAERTRRRSRNVTIGLVVAGSAIAAIVLLLAFRAREQADVANAARRRAEIAGADAKAKAIEASDARLLAGARELLSKLQLGAATKLLFEVQRPQQARGFFALANDALSYDDEYLSPEGDVRLRPGRRQILLRGHEKALSAALWSHDGKRILTASADGTTRIWSSDGRGTPLFFRSNGGAVRQALWSFDDSEVLTALEDGSVWVWKSNERVEPSQWFNKGTGVTAIAWSKRGDRIAAAGEDNVIRVKTRDQAIVELAGHTDTITRLVFLTEPDRLLSASADTTARIWDLDAAGKPIVFDGHEAAIRYTEPSPDGLRLVTVSADKTARIWDIHGKDKPLVLKGHEASVEWGAFSPDGLHVATASLDKTARIWSVDGTAAPIVLTGHRGPITRIAWRADGKYLVTASVDGDALVWPREGTMALALRGYAGPLLSASFSPDGSRVLTGVTAGTEASTIDFPAAIFYADRLSSLGRDRKEYYHSAAIDAKSQFVISAYDDRSVRSWRIDEASEPLLFTGHQQWVANAVPNSDGKRIITVSFDKTARVVSVDGSIPPIVLEGHSAAVRAAAWSPDGTRVVTISDDKTARIHAVDGQNKRLVLSGHTDALTAVAYAPDGKRIVTASLDQTARVWDIEHGSEPIILKGHSAAVLSVAWSHDGSRIVTGSADQTARVWNASTGAEIKVLDHESRVLKVLFSPNDASITTASADARISTFRADGAGEPLVFLFREGVLDMQFQNDGRELLVVGPNQHTRTFILDAETLKQRLREASLECLPVEMRATYLGEKEAVARERYAACERAEGRLITDNSRAKP